MIVRWGLHELPGVLDELGVAHPYLVTTHRWLDLVLPVEPIDTWASSPTHEIERVAEAARGAGVLLALGGGSAIDLGKAVSAQTELPLVSIPTTYSGAEWTTFYGVRDLDRRMRGGGADAHPAGIVYEPELTADLPPAESCGTALNALAHCAEALYVEGRNDEADLHALTGARLIATLLPHVLDDGHDLEARTGLLEGASEAGAALAGSFLALGHAMAQALGGRYGLPHGALNAICLPAALRFNAGRGPGGDRPARRGDGHRRPGRLGRGAGSEGRLHGPRRARRARGGPGRDRRGDGSARGREGEPASRHGRRRSPSCFARSGSRVVPRTFGCYGRTVDYRILGPLALVEDERDLAPAGAKQQALLGIFLLHPGETLSRDRLIDELWGARPPETAGNTLQVYVSQLRKLLPAGALVTRLPGYALEVDPDALDASRFERLARGGRDALARGDSAGASTALERALALWRGPVLAGVSFEGAAAGEAARLEELRISAAEDRIDAELALGRHAELVGELEALVAEHPLRERLRGQLMVALYRSGRQADALAVFQRTRAELVDQLGIEPGPQLQELQRARARSGSGARAAGGRRGGADPRAAQGGHGARRAADAEQREPRPRDRGGAPGAAARVGRTRRRASRRRARAHSDRRARSPCSARRSRTRTTRCAPFAPRATCTTRPRARTSRSESRRARR